MIGGPAYACEPALRIVTALPSPEDSLTIQNRSAHCAMASIVSRSRHSLRSIDVYVFRRTGTCVAATGACATGLALGAGTAGGTSAGVSITAGTAGVGAGAGVMAGAGAGAGAAIAMATGSAGEGGGAIGIARSFMATGSIWLGGSASYESSASSSSKNPYMPSEKKTTKHATVTPNPQ